MKRERPSIAIAMSLAAILLCVVTAGAAEKDKDKKPYTHYWISAWTQNQSIPGMQDMGAMFGKAAGFGPRRDLHLQVNSPQPLPKEPEATHDIPPGQKMGKTLPLMIPVREKVERQESRERQEQRPVEKPKLRMLIYWGCGETVGKGQPVVIDTEKMSPMDFGKAFAGRAATPQHPPSPRTGWIYADWPNQESRTDIPRDSSLQGDHFVHGNYIPDIRFAVDRRHDFMPPVEFTAVKGGLEESIRVEWREITTALGYFATAMAHNEQTGEMIFWSSSEVQEAGMGLMDYLTPSDVRRFIKDKVVMPPDVTRCAIPQGIFKGTNGSMFNLIAYGEDMYAEHPPRPKDPRQPYNPIWTLKLRLKSTGMTMLGMSEERQGRRSGRRQQRQEEMESAPQEERQEEGRDPADEERPGRSQRREKEKGGALDRVKGLFGF